MYVNTSIRASAWFASPDGISEVENVIRFCQTRGYPRPVSEDAVSHTRCHMLVKDASLPTGYHVRQLRLGASCYLKDAARHFRFLESLPAGYTAGSTGAPLEPPDASIVLQDVLSAIEASAGPTVASYAALRAEDKTGIEAAQAVGRMHTRQPKILSEHVRKVLGEYYAVEMA